MAKSRIRYEAIKVADLTDDQKSAVAILAALATSTTQEDLQEFVLSQIKRIIHGDAAGHWYDDFEGAGTLSLEELTAAVRDLQDGQHLSLDFSFADVPTSPKPLGSAPPGVFITSVVLIVLTPFDQPVLLEVGRTGAPAELMLAADSNPAVPDVYAVQPDLQYGVATGLYLTLIAPGIPPATGTGRVIVYFG